MTTTPEGAGSGAGGAAGGGGLEGPEGFARDEDGFQRLWTPHRMAYIGGENKPADSAAGRACPFCRAPTLEDDDALVVARGEECFAVLNLYPYNPGHLMVCPYRHVAGYVDLTASETAELATMTQSALRVLARAAGPAGFNLGMNQGEAGGAGIAAHLHQHVVPRWSGDANFLPVVGRTKALPELLADTRSRLARAWAASGEAGTTSSA